MVSAAEREAEQRWPNGTFGGLSYPISAVHAYVRGAFVAGAMWQAEQDHRIDAVRALHQPLDAINIDAPPGRQRTRVCAVCAGSRGPWAVWPCATIQAIEGDQT